MKKLIYIFLAIAIIIFISSLIYFFSALKTNQKSSRPSSTENNQKPISLISPKNNSTDQKATSQKLNTYLNKLQKYKKTDVADGGFTFSLNEKKYTMGYVPFDQSFFISILTPNFGEGREKAEEDLLKMLEINQQEACQLKIYIATPVSINEELAGRTFRLSFCQN